MSELKKFLLMFALALVIVFLGYKLFVRECVYVEAENKITKNCTCIGKKVNLNALFGNWDATEPPFWEHCVGVIKNRTY